jgi:4-hydroxy-tetrahydrodipicolinate synthase
MNARDGTDSHREIWPVPPVPFTPDNRVDHRALDELIDFYVQANVDGLFILAYSGEAFELSDEEHQSVCRQVVKRIAGRLPFVVAGNFSGDLDQQIVQLKRMAAHEAAATVIFLSKLPRATHLLDDLLTIATQVEGPLGVYECPAPEHRLLSASDVAVLARTGRFVFMKETSRQRETYRAKMQAAAGTPFKIFQANWGQLPGSLEDGSAGFCGIIANVFPELVKAFCNRPSASAVERETLHSLLADALSCITLRHYPATMKYVLQRRGIAMKPYARIASGQNVDDEDVRRLDAMLEDLNLLESPPSILTSIAIWASDSPHRVLKGPHHHAEWARRASSVPAPSDID